MADSSRWHRLRARLGRLILVCSVLGGVGALGSLIALLVLYQRHVVLEPGPHLSRAHIRSVIAQETPVYYRDGVTRVGVFFEEEHRQYVPWEELPQAYVMAIVAAEDGEFWWHAGVDPWGIARAMRDNIRAGRVVAGGSTLTQQTAKNLYYRPDRSLKSKGTEALNALRLEAHYEKTEILTFYVNQFHVSGNGRGLGIGARHFFDKEVAELTLVESAFLAGLVKSPSYYDPFIGDAARRERSEKRAHDRTRYVLSRMVTEPAENLAGPVPGAGVTRAEYRERLAEAQKIRQEAQRLLDEGFEIPFARGTFRYDSSAVLDEVARRLEEPPFDTLLAEMGVDDPSTSGLVVVTTLDPDAQHGAIYGLWHHLSEVGPWLEGLTAEDFKRDGSGPRYDPDRPPEWHQFRLGRVVERPDAPKHLIVDLGGHLCTVDREGIVRGAVAVYRGQQRNRYAKAPTAFVDAFADSFAVEDVVWVSVRTAEPAVLCDLEVRPRLQGATMVLEDGQIRAMVGGNDNRNFNRATALRQMGSTFKPLIYHAALQLGWRPDDRLDNRRNVFPFSTTYYYPRPDHDPVDEVSMAWAGVNSENLASIWLLYHLTDRLDQTEIASLAAQLDLVRREGESAKEYRTRIQKAGVLPLGRRVDEALFLQARSEVLRSNALEAWAEDELPLLSLLYGWGYRTELKRATSSHSRAALENSWQHLQTRTGPCTRQHRVLSAALEGQNLPPPAEISDLAVFVDGDRVRVACGALPPGYAPPDEALLQIMFPPEEPRPTGILERRFPNLFGGGKERTPGGPGLDDSEDMLVEDRLHLGTLLAVDRAFKRRTAMRELLGDDAPGLYDPDLLYWHQDFRVLLNLRFVMGLAQEYGVQTHLPPILSLPLGAQDITLEESTTLYQGLLTGERWTFPGERPGMLGMVDVPPPEVSTLLISELRDVDGNVVYKALPTKKQVVPAETGALTAGILRNVVQHGTGRRARTSVMEQGAPVPLGGKTGTTNDFRNAVFLGFAPRAAGMRYAVEDGYIVGVYVGYDDNQPLSNGRIRLSGASGALPAWIGAVGDLHASGLLGVPDEGPAEGAWDLWLGGPALRVAVDGEAGLPLEEGHLAEEPAQIWVPLPELPGRLALEVGYDPDRPSRPAPRTENYLKRLRDEETSAP